MIARAVLCPKEHSGNLRRYAKMVDGAVPALCFCGTLAGRFSLVSETAQLASTVLVAANAVEAIQLFDQNSSIEVLLTDVVMPGASGPDLTTELIKRRPTLKVVYMSGFTDEAIVHHGVLEPGIIFLHKPFTAEALEAKIREALDR